MSFGFHRAFVIGLFCGAVACAGEPQPDSVTGEEEAPTVGHLMIGESIQALEGDCGGTSACSYGSWSTWSNSGASYCGGTTACVFHTYPEWTILPGRQQGQQRFRACTYSNETTCIEYESRVQRTGCCPED